MYVIFFRRGYSAIDQETDPMQLVDELSMIYTTCIMCYAIFTRNRSVLYSSILGGLLATLSVSITAYYHYVKDPIFHQVAYGLLTALLFFRSVYDMEVNLRPSSKKLVSSSATNGLIANGSSNGSTKQAIDLGEQQRQDKRDEQIVKTMWTMIPIGLSIFLGGFAIWNLDNLYCSDLRTWRRQIGLPWGIILEGHGWW
jgi:dihydroceramidase